MVTKRIDPIKPVFWAEIFTTCDNESCIFWFYLIKPNICNLAENKPPNQNIYIIIGVVK
jgi:hypothetical protein